MLDTRSGSLSSFVKSCDSLRLKARFFGELGVESTPPMLPDTERDLFICSGTSFQAQGSSGSCTFSSS